MSLSWVFFTCSVPALIISSGIPWETLYKILLCLWRSLLQAVYSSRWGELNIQPCWDELIFKIHSSCSLIFLKLKSVCSLFTFMFKHSVKLYEAFILISRYQKVKYSLINSFSECQHKYVPKINNLKTQHLKKHFIYIYSMYCMNYNLWY